MSLTMAQVAKEAQVSEETIRKQIHAGNLEAWKPDDKSIRIEPHAVEQWKKARRVKTQSKVPSLRAIEGGAR